MFAEVSTHPPAEPSYGDIQNQCFGSFMPCSSNSGLTTSEKELPGRICCGSVDVANNEKAAYKQMPSFAASPNGFYSRR